MNLFKDPLLVFEDIHTTPRRKLFRLLGVDWVATPYAWLSLPFFILPGILIAAGYREGEPVGQILGAGVVYGLLIFLINALHSVGHILSGKIVGAAMDANLVTATRHVNLYSGDQSGYSKGVHIGRALGGSVFNLLIGLAVWGLQWAFTGKPPALSGPGSGEWLTFFANINVMIGIFVLAPVPSIDGWVIWGEVLGLRRRA